MAPTVCSPRSFVARAGPVMEQTLRHHRANQFEKFLDRLDEQVAAQLEVRLILDNYATHRRRRSRAGWHRRPRVSLHFTPTSSSWPNLVERLLAEITRQRSRRGTFDSVPELEAAITAWIDHRNVHPKPFIWTAKAGTIVAKHRRARKYYAASIAATNV